MAACLQAKVDKADELKKQWDREIEAAANHVGCAQATNTIKHSGGFAGPSVVSKASKSTAQSRPGAPAAKAGARGRAVAAAPRSRPTANLKAPAQSRSRSPLRSQASVNVGGSRLPKRESWSSPVRVKQEPRGISGGCVELDLDDSKEECSASGKRVSRRIKIELNVDECLGAEDGGALGRSIGPASALVATIFGQSE